MPSNKTSVYDGVVYIDDESGAHVRDFLDLSGWVNRKSSANYSVGTSSVTLNNFASGNIKKGAVIIATQSKKLIGKIAKDVVHDGSNATIDFGPTGIKNPLSSGEWISIYPRFEIVKIQILNVGTVLATESDASVTGALVGTSDRFNAGTLDRDLNTWSSTTKDTFGTPSNQGKAMTAIGAFIAGTIIEGRWSQVMMDRTASLPTPGAMMCYLKATPTIM